MMEQAHPTTDYSLMFTAMKNELKRISEQQMEERHDRFDELSKSFTRGSRSRFRNRSNRGTKGANYEEYSRLVKMWKEPRGLKGSRLRTSSRDEKFKSLRSKAKVTLRLSWNGKAASGWSSIAMSLARNKR